MRVGLEERLSVVVHDGSEFLHHAEHGGAAGTTVEPDDDGVGGGRVHRLGEGVMKGLGLGSLQVAGVGVGLPLGSVWQVSSKIFLGGGHDGSSHQSKSEEFHVV